MKFKSKGNKDTSPVQSLYKHKRLTKSIILLISIFLTITFVITLLFISRTYIEQVGGNFFYGENETTYSNLEFASTGPNYFFPNAEVHTKFEVSNYKLLENVSIWMSVDNLTWVRYSSNIYVKSYGSDAQVIFGDKLTPIYQVLNACEFRFTYMSILSSQSIIVLILVSLAVFSFLIQILDFLAKDK
jgi:hypothetical protein